MPLNNHNIEPTDREILGHLADQLVLQPDLISLIVCVINYYQSIFECKAKIWIADSLRELLGNRTAIDFIVNTNKLTTLMIKARNQNILFYESSDSQSANAFSTVIAFPLSINGEVMSVISLDRDKQSGFTPQELNSIYCLAQLTAVAVYSKKLQITTERQHSRYDRQELINQISKSIIAILDLDHLVNSTITLIHQNYDFSKISIYLTNNGEINDLFRISITKDGVETENQYSLEFDDHPIAWIIRNKDTLIINNTTLDGRFAPQLSDGLSKSKLLIPLFSGVEIVGVLELLGDHENEFGPEVVEDFRHLSEYLSVAIRNARIFKKAYLSSTIAERIDKIIAGISADISFDELMDRLLIEVNNFIPYDSSAVWVIDENSDRIGIGQFTSSIRLAGIKINNFPAPDSSILLSEYADVVKKDLVKISEGDIDLIFEFPWIEQVINSHSPVIRDIEYTKEPLGHVQNYPDDYSCIGIPLVVNNRILGVMILCKQLPGQYTQESLLTGEILSNHAALAIDKSRLFSATHEQMWTSTVLWQIAQTSQTMGTLTDLLDAVAGMLNNFIGIQSCVFYLLDQSETTLYPQLSYGFTEKQQARLNEWTLQSSSVIAFDEMMGPKSPVIFSSSTLSEEIASLIFPDYDLDHDLFILFPMVTGDIVIGALLINFEGTKLQMDSPQKDWDDMYAILQGVTNQVAVTIQNLQVTKSREEEAYISVALLQVAQAIVSLNKLVEILSSIVRITPILVGVKRCIIYLWEREKVSFRVSQYYGFTKNDLRFEDEYFKANEFPFVEYIYEQNKIGYYPLSIEDNPSDWSDISRSDIRIIQENPLDGQSVTSYSLSSSNISEKQHLLIGFPLTIINDVLGVMLIEEEDPIRGIPSSHIREKRIEIVNGITRQTAIAIKNDLLQQEAVNSERMERELQLARDIQRTFLPDHIPTIPGWEIVARWQPAREVGGDFYDILQLDDDHVGFVIADVADKGMPAALFMTLIRTLIRAAARDNLSPAIVLKQVNDLLLQDAKNGMFVTVFYTVFNIHSGVLTYANSGHNPPVIKYGNRDDLLELTRTSMALGIFPDIDVDERQIQLNIGDLLLLYTDGVTEAFSKSDEMFGTTRLYDLIRNNKYQNSIDMLDAIDQSINEFVDGMPLQDDLTVAVIHKINR